LVTKNKYCLKIYKLQECEKYISTGQTIKWDGSNRFISAVGMKQVEIKQVNVKVFKKHFKVTGRMGHDPTRAYF